MKALQCILILIAMSVTGVQAQSHQRSSVRDALVGAWHLVRINAPGPDGESVAAPQPKGMLIYTRDGHMSVQLMYPKSANSPDNEYVLGGYEASFGSYDLDEAKHTITHHVLGSITRDLLVGKDLPRLYQLTADGRLIIRSVDSREHWSVIWTHY